MMVVRLLCEKHSTVTMNNIMYVGSNIHKGYDNRMEALILTGIIVKDF